MARTKRKTQILCEICNVYVSGGNQDAHNAGRKHRHYEGLRSQNLPIPVRAKAPALPNAPVQPANPPVMTKKAMKIEKAQRTLFLGNLPSGILRFELMEFFSQYGPVANARIFQGGSQGSVQFAVDIDFAKVISSRNVLYGQEITVSDILPPKVPQRDFFPTEDISKGQFVYEKIKGLPMDEQLEKFLSVVRLSPEGISDRMELVGFISREMQEFFPGSRLEIYGSTVSGLGFRGCDVDLTFMLPFERVESDILVMGRVPTCMDVRMGKFPRDDLAFMSRENILHFLWKLIARLPGFKFTRLIRSARCPIIKFHYSHNGLSVCGDISFNKCLGIVNTNLIRLYSQLDLRVHVILMILRFWGKRESIVGSNHMITSYAFNWLVIFYLQSINMVPTLETLSALAGVKNMAEGWDASFCEDRSKIPMQAKTESIVDLLTGFFGFYAAFDFTVNVICPRDGNIVLKTKLVELAGEDLDFNITDLSVQDVFDLTHNITAAVNATTIQIFISQCNAQYAYWKEMGHGKDLQSLFFSQTVSVNVNRPKITAPMTKVTVKSAPKVMPIKTPKITPQATAKFAPKVTAKFEITTPKITPQATAKFDPKVTAKFDTKAPAMFDLSLPLDYAIHLPLKCPQAKIEYSVETLCNFVMDILRRVGLFECIVMESTLGDGSSIGPSSSLKRTIRQGNVNCKRLKTSDSVSASTQESVVLRVVCNVYCRVWDGRRKVQGFKSTTPQLEMQEGISNAIAKRDEFKPRQCLHVFESVFVAFEDQLKVSLIPKGTKPELLNAVLPFTQRSVCLLAKACLKLDATQT